MSLEAPQAEPQSAPGELLTEQEFLANIGRPALAFSMPTRARGLRIPHRGAHCCRVTHQPTCRKYIALSLVGAIGRVRYPREPGQRRGLVQERGTRGEYEGDILADPLALTAAAKTMTLSLAATAQALGGRVLKSRIYVWSLGFEMAVAFARIKRQAADLAAQSAASAGWNADQIAGLPFRLLDPEDEDRLQEVMEDPLFQPVREYAALVATVPGERGHNGLARYVLSTVWPEDGLAIANILGLTELGPPPEQAG